MDEVFADRKEAGRRLAGALTRYAGRPDDVLVLGLPRGGVPVAFEVAQALGAALDVLVVRKLGAPWQEELAIGAIGSGDVVVLNEELVRALDVDETSLNAAIERERAELRRREHTYRGDQPPLDPTNRDVILVDDGMATGASMRAGAAALRQRGARHVTVAVPVAPPSSCQMLASEVDEVVCLVQPEPFHAVGLWYEEFTQTTDDEVRELLEQARRRQRERPAAAPPPMQ